MRRLATTLTTAALVVALAGPAAADGPGDAIDEMPSSAYPDSITQLDEEVTTLDPQVTQLEPQVTKVERERQEGDETVISLVSDILFAFGKSSVAGGATGKIRDLVSDVPRGATVQVSGHTDSIGSTSFNQKLSRQRAEAVAKVIKQARPDLRLSVKGYGESRPVEPNRKGGEDNPDGRAKNRRVEIRYHG